MWKSENTYEKLTIYCVKKGEEYTKCWKLLKKKMLLRMILIWGR